MAGHGFASRRGADSAGPPSWSGMSTCQACIGGGLLAFALRSLMDQLDTLNDLVCEGGSSPLSAVSAAGVARNEALALCATGAARQWSSFTLLTAGPERPAALKATASWSGLCRQGLDRARRRLLHV